MSKEESINNLKRYIEEDVIYQENKPESDFDKFCIGHCKDIDTVLGYVKELEEKIKLCEDSGAKLINKKTFTDNFINKQVIRDKILYYKSFGIHKVNNGLIGEKFSEWTEYVMQDEIDILNELLEEE